MKCKTYILLILSFGYGVSAMAQATNRQKIVNMILSGCKFKAHIARSYQSELLVNDLSGSSSIMLAPAVCPVPRYSLPKGNVFCRLEDYVQMHTPMKLNIGVGGQ
jgi:hypothetical protein